MRPPVLSEGIYDEMGWIPPFAKQNGGTNQWVWGLTGALQVVQRFRDLNLPTDSSS